MHRVDLREVGPRDGLQGQPGSRQPTQRRVELVRRLAAAGLSRIEVGSFVSERAVPQMAGTGTVVKETSEIGCSVEVLTVNGRGAQAAVSSACDVVLAVVAATDSFSQRNVRTGRQDALTAAAEIANVARAGDKRAIANIAVAFGCPDEGRVPPETVAAVAEQLLEMSFDEIFLSDTIGVAGPRDVHTVVAAVADVVPLDRIGLHLHDTRGLGLVNALAGLDAGIHRFDASIGGIGGCPFAPGASGNVATEDVVNLFEHLGVDTGVDLDALNDTARWLAKQLGIDLPGHVSRARHRVAFS